MRITITGGAGFIGSHLVPTLLAQGHQVRVIDNFSTGRKQNIPAGVEVFEGDVNNYHVTKPATKGVDVVVHLAAIPWVQYSAVYPEEAWKANALATYMAVRWARRHLVRRFVFSSSCAVYGNPLSKYGEAKKRSEQFLGNRPGYMEAVCLRFFNVYGDEYDNPSGYSRVIPAFIENVRKGKPMRVNGDGLQTRDFIHVDDVVRSLVAAITLPDLSGRSIDVGTGIATSILDLGKVIARILGKEPTFIHGSPLPGEMREACADMGAMKATLGINEVLPLEQGLLKSVRSFSAV